MNDTARIKVELNVIAVTDRAIGIGDDKDVNHWIPKSQIEEIILTGGETRGIEDVVKGDFIEIIVMPQWLADDKGL